MEFIVLILIIIIGLAILQAIHQHQERMIAKKGYKYYLGSTRWKKKAAECKRRFGNRCALCYSPLNLETHHRTYLRLYNEPQGDLTCLCRTCHQITTDNVKLYKG